jgi:hypothetical protein
LYCPNKNQISLPPTQISPAGTSVFTQICLYNSDIKLWQNFITSLSDFHFGLKSLQPFQPHIGRVVRAFLKTCSNQRNFKILALTDG